MAAYRYTACGLEIQSEFPISHLPKSKLLGPVDIRISLAQSLIDFDASISSPQWRANNEHVELYGISGEACICTAGSQITFSGIPPSLDETCTLLGRALAVVSMQRGNPALHAAVVEKDGMALAISGRSGAGKSTLTEELIRRQYRVVADDISVFDSIENAFIVQPLYPMIRRRADYPPPDGWKAIPGLQKHVSTNVPFCPAARKVQRLFVLDVSSSSSQPIRIHSLAVNRRHDALEPHLYRTGIARAIMGYNGLRRKTERAVHALPVSSVRRPPDCDPVELADAIIDHLAST